MKYRISDVLAGYDAHHAEHLKSLEAEVEKLQSEYDGWLVLGQARRPQIVDELKTLSIEVEEDGSPVTLKLLTSLHDQLKPYFLDLPSSGDFAHNGRAMGRATERLESARRADTPALVQWLRVMQTTGLSEISPYAVKQAGYNPQDLARYVMAGARAGQK